MKLKFRKINLNPKSSLLPLAQTYCRETRAWPHVMFATHNMQRNTCFWPASLIGGTLATHSLKSWGNHFLTHKSQLRSTYNTTIFFTSMKITLDAILRLKHNPTKVYPNTTDYFSELHSLTHHTPDLTWLDINSPPLATGFDFWCMIVFSIGTGLVELYGVYEYSNNALSFTSYCWPRNLKRTQISSACWAHKQEAQRVPLRVANVPCRWVLELKPRPDMIWLKYLFAWII